MENDTEFCEAKRDVPLGNTTASMRCDLYAMHGGGRHRTVLSTTVTVFWADEKRESTDAN